MADELVISDLTIMARQRELVSGVSLRLGGGELVALVGESGSGKTMTARSCLGLVQPKPGVVGGGITVRVGDELHTPYEAPDRAARERAFAAIRGRLVGYLPQHALAALDPLWRVGKQVSEVVLLRSREGTLSAQEQSPLTWLRRAGFERPELVVNLFPHELSGGMAQRVCIALALARGSRFLIADEPTTGLDPTVQKGILDHVRHLRDSGIGILLITHDLRIVPTLAARVVVLHDGRVVDEVDAQRLEAGNSPHTRRLLVATARVAGGLL